MGVLGLVAGLVLCSLSLFYGSRGQRFMGRPLGGDFAQFYVVGTILNHYEPARIYDIDLEAKLYRQLTPGAYEKDMLVYGSAPYLAVLFRPLAALPYIWAYSLWLLACLGLYIAGVRLLFIAELPPQYWKTGYLLALSFPPFIFETWIGGQVSVLGFFGLACALYFRHRRMTLIAGAVLALGLFKPTLIAVPALMLITGRRWRMAAGFCTGALGFAAISWVAVGRAGCMAWLQTLAFYSQLAATTNALKAEKYMDFHAFLTLIFGPGSLAVQILAALAAVAIMVLLGTAWWRSKAWTSQAKNLLWAATLSWTLLINLYVPIYDTLLLVAAATLTFSLYESSNKAERSSIASWMLLLYMVPWLTQALAEFLHIQLLTILLAGFGAFALHLAYGRERGESEAISHAPVLPPQTVNPAPV